jgi:hypothetical protein
MSLVSHETVCERRWDRHLAMVVVDGCVFVLLVAVGLYQDCTQPNVMYSSIFDNVLLTPIEITPCRTSC